MNAVDRRLSAVTVGAALLFTAIGLADAQTRTSSDLARHGEWRVAATSDTFTGKTDCLLVYARHNWISAYRDEVTLSFLVAKRRKIDARIDGGPARHVPISRDGRMAYIDGIDFARHRSIAVRVASEDEAELLLTVDLSGIAAAWRRAGEAPCPPHAPRL